MIETARLGVFRATRCRVHAELHSRRRHRSFSEYYVARYDSASSRGSSSRNVVFAGTISPTDAAFNEFNVITCRNVMIYFAQPLQAHVHRLFYESLATFGVLALGQKETIRFSPHEDCYEELDAEERLYKKVR